MDVDVFEHGWEHISDYKSLISDSSREGSSTTLSPSLQSYHDINNNNNHPSWPSSSAFSPYQQSNPTCIRRVDIARTVRRHGPSWARKRGKPSLYRGATNLGSPSAHAAPGVYAKSIIDGKATTVNPTNCLDRVVPLNAQFRHILERGWDGRMALGRRTGGERRLLAARLSTSASAPSFEEKTYPYLAAPKSWDNPRMRANVRSAGRSRGRGSIVLRDTSFLDPDDLLGRGADQTGNPSSIHSGGQMRTRRPRTAPGLQPPRLSPSWKRGRTRALSRDANGPDSSTIGLQNAGAGGGFDGLSPSGFAADHARPELSRSLSPSPNMGVQTTNRHLPPFTSYSFGPSRQRAMEEETARRGQEAGCFVTVRALSLLPSGSIGQEVSAVGMSPSDSVRSLRAAIHADIDRNKRPTIDANHRGGSDGGGSPAFLFSYADGVPIDRGQEGRVSVQDIAIASSPSRTTHNADDPGGEGGGGGGGGWRSAEVCVFLRACSFQSSELEMGDGGCAHEGGVLSRWGRLPGEGGSCGDEAFPLDDSAGSPERLRSNGAGSLSSFPVVDAISPFYGGSEEMHWSVDGREETGLHDCGGLTRGVVVNVGSPQGPSQRRRVSVSFDESKAARRQRILEQVERLASSKATTIAKVCRGHQARVVFRERLDRHQKALTIQLCARRWSAKLELELRARRRDGAVKMQALVRSCAARQRLSLRRDFDRQAAAATRIQCNARKTAARREFESRWRMRRAVVVLQCWARFKAARKIASATLGVNTPADPGSVATAAEKQDASVADRPLPDTLLSAEETTYPAPLSARGSLVDAEGGGVPVADAPDKYVVMTAEATAHQVAPSGQGAQAETLVATAAAAGESEVLQQGASPGKERSAAASDPFDTVAVGADEPNLDGAGRHNAEPDGVTSEDTGTGTGVLSLAAEERAAATGEEHLGSDEAKTECMPCTAYQNPPPDEEGGEVVVCPPAAAVIDGDVPEVARESPTQQGGDTSGFEAPEEEPASVADVALAERIRPDPERTTPNAGGAIPPVVSEDFNSVAGEALGAVKAAESATPTSLDSEETLVAENKVSAAINATDQATAHGPASMTPSPENMTPGTEVPVTVPVTDDVNSAGTGIPRTVEDSGVEVGTPIAEEEIQLTANRMSASIATGSALSEQPALETAAPKRSAMISNERADTSVTVDPFSSATETPGTMGSTAAEEEEETLPSEIEGSASAIVQSLMPADESSMETVAPKLVTSVAEEIATVPAFSNRAMSIPEAPGVEGSIDIAQLNHASAEEIVAGAVEVGVFEAAVDGEPTDTIMSPNVTSIATGGVAVTVTGGSSQEAMETLEKVDGADIGRSIFVAGEETFMAAMQPTAPTDATDATLVEQPASEITNTPEARVAVPGTNDSCLPTAEKLDSQEDVDAGDFSPLTGEVLVASEGNVFTADDANGVSAEPTSVETPALEHRTHPAKEKVGALATSETAFSDTKNMGMTEDTDVAQSNPSVGEKLLVASTETTALFVEPNLALTELPAPATSALEYETPKTGGPVPDPVTSDPILQQAATFGMEEGSQVEQSTSATRKATPAASVATGVAASPTDGLSAGQLGSGIAVVERIATKAGDRTDTPATIDSTSSDTEALGAMMDVDTEQLTPVGAHETLKGAIEETAPTFVLGEGSADEPASVAAPSDCTPCAAVKPIAVPIVDVPAISAKDDDGMDDNLEVGQSIVVPEQDMVGATVEQSSSTFALDGALGEDISSVTPPAVYRAPAELGASSAEAPPVSTPVTGDPTLSTANVSEVKEYTVVEQATLVAGKSALVTTNEDSSAPDIILQEILAEEIASGVGAPKYVAMATDQPVAVPNIRDPTSPVEKALAMADSVGVEKITPAATGETLVALLEDGTVLHEVSTENTVSDSTAPANYPLAVEDSVAGPAKEKVAQPVPAPSDGALADATEDWDPLNALKAACGADPDSAAAPSPEHTLSAEEETIDHTVPNGFTPLACEAVGMTEGAEVTQIAAEPTKEFPVAVIGDIAPSVVVDAALTTEDGSITAASTLVASAAGETVQVSVSGGPTPSDEVLRTSDDAEVETSTAVAEEGKQIEKNDAADLAEVRDGVFTEDLAFTADVDEVEMSLTEGPLTGQELGKYTSSIGKPSILTAEDAVEVPADKASAAMTEDREAQHGADEIAESQGAEATTLEVVAAEAPDMTEVTDDEKKHPVAGEQASLTTTAGIVALDAPLLEGNTLGSAARIEGCPEVGESFALVITVDDGAELSADTSLVATMGNSEPKKVTAGNDESQSAGALPMEVAEEPSASADDAEVRRRTPGTGSQAPEDSVEDMDPTSAADEATARDLSSTTSPEIHAELTSKELLDSQVAGDFTVSVFEAPSPNIDGVTDKSAEIPPASMTEDTEAHQVVAGTAKGGTAEVFTPETTKEVQETVEDTQTELPQLVAEEETTFVANERTYQTLVHDGAPKENPAPTAHAGHKPMAGEPTLETPATKDPFVDQLLGDPALRVDETSAPVVDNAVIGSVDTNPVEVIEGVEAHEANAKATKGKWDETFTPKDIHPLSKVEDYRQTQEPIPVGEDVVSYSMPHTVAVDRTATAEPGFVTATEGEASPVAEEAFANGVLGGPAVSMDTSSTLSVDACGDASVDQPFVATVDEDGIQQADSGSTPDTQAEMLTAKQPTLVTGTDEPVDVTKASASVPAADGASAKELCLESPQKEENFQALEESHTQPMSDGPTPLVDSLSTFTVDSSVDMVVDTPTITASGEGETSQGAADSAECRPMKVATPEVAVEITPEVLPTPAQEEVVSSTEELPADVLVANDGPETTGETESGFSHPGHGEEETVTTTEKVASTIQGGSITEEPATLSGIPQEETFEESHTQPVTDGPTPSVDEASTITVDVSTDMVVGTPTMTAGGEDAMPHAAVNSAGIRPVKVVTSELAVKISPEVSSPPAQEEIMPAAEEIPAGVLVTDDAPRTAGDAEREDNDPVHGKETVVAATKKNIQDGSTTEEPAAVSDIPHERAPEESHTQPVSGGPTPSVDEASTLTVDASIDMVVDTPTLTADGEDDISQAAADCAAFRPVEVVTPELAIEISPEISSPPAHEEIVPAAEELPADVLVSSDAPGTADDAKRQRNDPVYGEETIVAATEKAASAIQGGSTTEEPAVVSDTPQEEAPTFHEPLKGGFFAPPTASVGNKSALFIAHDVDGSKYNAPEDIVEEGEVRQVVIDGTDYRGTGTSTYELPTETSGTMEDPEAKEGLPTAEGEPLVAAIRKHGESADNDASETTEATKGGEAQDPAALFTGCRPAGVIASESQKEKAEMADVEENPEVDTRATMIGEEATPAMDETNGSIVGLDKLKTGLDGSNVDVHGATVDETIPLFSTKGGTASPAEKELVGGVPGDPDALIDDGSSSKYADVVESADEPADETSTILGEGSEGQQKKAGMPEGTQVDMPTPDVDDHALATVKGTELEQSISQEPTSIGYGSDEAEPRAEDVITDVVSRGSISLSDGTSVAAAIGTADLSAETSVTATTEDVGQRRAVAGVVEGELAEVPTAEEFAIVNAAADTKINVPASVRGQETPVAAVTDEAPSAVDEEACYDAPAEERETSVDETPAPSATLDGASAAVPAFLDAAEGQEADTHGDPVGDVVSGDTPLSLGETPAPAVAVVDGVEDTGPVPGTHGSTAEQRVSLASAEEIVPIVPAAEHVDGVTADETTPLPAAEGSAISPSEEKLAKGVPGDLSALIDDVSLAEDGDVDNSVDKPADDASTILGEGSEGQQIKAGMPEVTQVDMPTPDVDYPALATVKGAELEQSISQEPISTAAGSDEAEPRAEDVITDVVPRGSISLSDGTSVAAAIGTADLSAETSVTATTEDVGQRRAVAGVVEGELAEVPTAEEFAIVNAAADTKINVPASVRGQETPVAAVTDEAPSAAVDGTVVEEACYDAPAEERETSVDETPAPSATLDGASAVVPAFLDAAEGQEACTHEDPVGDVVSSGTPLSLGKTPAPAVAVADAVEDTGPVPGADESTAEQPISQAAGEENVPTVSAGEDSLTDTVSGHSTAFALGSADKTFRGVPLAATASKEEVQDLPVEMTESGRVEMLKTEATGEETTAENGHGLESVPAGGEDAFVSVIEGDVPIVAHGEEAADKHASFNTREEGEAAPTINEHLAGTVFGGPAMLDGETPVTAEDGAMGTLQGNVLGNSIAGGTADEPAEKQSPEARVEASAYAVSAEVGNRSVLASGDKPGLSYGENNPPTSLDNRNADKSTGGVFNRQSTHEAEETSPEGVETTTGVPTPNAADTLVSLGSKGGAEEAGDVSEAALQASAGSGGSDSVVDEAPALINDHHDELPAKQARGSSVEGENIQGGRDAQRAETSAETAGKELIAADGSDLRQEGAQDNSSASGVSVDKTISGAEGEEDNEADPEEALSVNKLADEMLDEALPLDTEPCASSTAQLIDGSAEHPAASTVEGDEEKHAVACVTEGKATNTHTPGIIEKDSPTEADSLECTVRALSSKDDMSGAPPEGDTPSFASSKVIADEPLLGTSMDEQEEAPAPEDNLAHRMKIGLAPSANEKVSLAVAERVEESAETATAAGTSLVEDTLTVASDETILLVDKQGPKGTSTAAAAKKIDAQESVGETVEGELSDVPIAEAAKVEEASEYAGEGAPMGVVKNSAPTAPLDRAVVDVPPGSTEKEAEAALLAEQNHVYATLSTPRSSAEEAAAGALTVNEAVNTSPNEGMAEAVAEGELPQTIPITGEEGSPVGAMTSVDTASVGAEKEAPADGARSVGEATVEETVSAGTGTEHLSSNTIEGAVFDEGISATSPAAGRKGPIDETDDAGEEHEVRLEEPVADVSGLRPAPEDSVVAADQVKVNPTSAPTSESGVYSEDPTSSPEEKRLMAGGLDHPISLPPPEAASSAEVRLVDSTIEVHVVGPTSDVLEGQEIKYIAVKEETTPPAVSHVPLALEAGVRVPTAGKSGDEMVEQATGISKENAEVAQPKNVTVQGLTDEPPVDVKVVMKQEETLATRVEDYRLERAVGSDAAAPQMENHPDQSGSVLSDDGAALDNKGNSVEEGRGEFAVTVVEPLDKTRQEASVTRQISELKVRAGGTLSVDDIVSAGDEGVSDASTAVGDDKVLTATPGGSLKPTPETIENGTSEFSEAEGVIVPEAVSMDMNAAASMGDKSSAVFPVVEAVKIIPLAPDNEIAHKEEELAVDHERIPVHESMDGAGKLEAGVEQAVLVTTEDEASVAAFDGVLPDEMYRERVPSLTAAFAPTAEDNSEEEGGVNKTPVPLVVRGEVDHEVDQLAVTKVGGGSAAKNEKGSSKAVHLGTGEEEPALVSDELRESVEVLPVAVEIVHIDNPSSEDIEGRKNASDATARSTPEQAPSTTTLEGVGASLAMESDGITDIVESTPASIDEKADVTTAGQPQEQAATSTSKILARASNESAVGLPPGTNVTLENDEAREEIARAAEKEKGGGHTLPNAAMKDQNEGLPADEA